MSLSKVLCAYVQFWHVLYDSVYPCFIQHDSCTFSPHLCVGFLFLVLYPVHLSSFRALRHTQLCHTPSFKHNFVTHTIFQTQLCHTPSFKHNFVTHHLCHTAFFTHNFVTHHLSHTTLSHTTLSNTIVVTQHLSHTTLSHTIFHIQLCHTQLCHTPYLSHTHTQLCHTSFFTYNFVTHHPHTIFATSTFGSRSISPPGHNSIMFRDGY